jgi:hypothetical protein
MFKKPLFKNMKIMIHDMKLQTKFIMVLLSATLSCYLD